MVPFFLLMSLVFKILCFVEIYLFCFFLSFWFFFSLVIPQVFLGNNFKKAITLWIIFCILYFVTKVSFILSFLMLLKKKIVYFHNWNVPKVTKYSFVPPDLQNAKRELILYLCSFCFPPFPIHFSTSFRLVIHIFFVLMVFLNGLGLL